MVCFSRPLPRAPKLLLTPENDQAQPQQLPSPSLKPGKSNLCRVTTNTWVSMSRFGSSGFPLTLSTITVEYGAITTWPSWQPYSECTDQFCQITPSLQRSPTCYQSLRT